MQQLPPLRDVIKEFSLSAKKSLGQNFLLDLNVTNKIASLAGAKKGKKFLEIGAGPGGLTRSLLDNEVDHVTVIEKDDRCIEALKQIEKYYPNRLKIIHGNALNIDYNDIYKEPYHIAANLPYNISSQIIIKLLTDKKWPPLWESASLMFQKEFAQRLYADVGTKSYGRLTVLCSLRADAEKVYELHPQYFTPPPKIMSYVMKITPHNLYPDFNMDLIGKITHSCFSQRRKMIRQSLKGICNNPIELCEKLGISSELRADHLSPEDYLRMSNELNN